MSSNLCWPLETGLQVERVEVLPIASTAGGLGEDSLLELRAVAAGDRPGRKALADFLNGRCRDRGRTGPGISSVKAAYSIEGIDLRSRKPARRLD